MNELMTALGALVDYQVGEVTAAAAYYLAEVYGDFSRSLLESERPGDLSGADLADYEATLEEEAFPFEEKAIRVHEKNLELMASGVYNGWIEKSLDRLATLMPGRYAKPEESTGPLASLEAYTYRSPAAVVAQTPVTPTDAPPTATAEAPAAPAPEDAPTTPTTADSIEAPATAEAAAPEEALEAGEPDPITADAGAVEVVPDAAPAPATEADPMPPAAMSQEDADASAN
ncbi:MAG: hypothetical protein IPK00_15115 [Deltaproteobacteria bacterium]|nr:hypothetical protein [Deltaproteobacteria bacterium]